MRTLIVESEPGVAADAVELLRAEGHDIVRCFDPAAHRSAPCVGLERRGACPLDDAEGVDVVVDVRSGNEALPTPQEVGVTCALRQRIPLVVAGHGGANPFARWAGAVVPVADVVVGCETARRRALQDLGAEVSTAVCRGLEAAYVPGVDVSTEVRHTGRDLDVVIHRPPAEAARDEVIALRAHRALRDAGVAVPGLAITCRD